MPNKSKDQQIKKVAQVKGTKTSDFKMYNVSKNYMV